MKTKRILALLVFLLPAFAAEAHACSCIYSGPPCSAYWKASAVFTGTVSYISPTTQKLGDYEFEVRLVRFHVERSFRGIKGTEIELRTGLGGGDCGYPFRLGGQYLVYAYEDNDQRLTASICSRTQLITEASDDLAYIAGLAKAEPGGTIFGEVKLMKRELEPPAELPPVAGAKIVVETQSKRFEVVTDTKGDYRVAGLPPGKYSLTIEPPAGLTVHDPKTEAELHDRGCADVSFWLEADTRVTGKVLDEYGKPAEDVLIELVPVEQRGVFPSLVRTDLAGRYEIKLLKPGRYRLGVRIYGSAGATYVPFPRTFHPGVADEAGATVIALAEGQQIELSELVLPSRFVERTLNGVVVDLAGKPASGAIVWLKENQYSDHDMPYRNDTDSEGRFSFKVYEGINYTLNAYQEIDEEKRREADQVAVRVSANPETIRLVLKNPK